MPEEMNGLSIGHGLCATVYKSNKNWENVIC